MASKRIGLLILFVLYFVSESSSLLPHHHHEILPSDPVEDSDSELGDKDTDKSISYAVGDNIDRIGLVHSRKFSHGFGGENGGRPEHGYNQGSGVIPIYAAGGANNHHQYPHRSGGCCNHNNNHIGLMACISLPIAIASYLVW